jgi:hypothetical protein
VKVETILVESDSVAKAVQDLITILNIRKLVLGIDKSNARYIYIHKDEPHNFFSCQMTRHRSLFMAFCRKASTMKGNSVPELIMRSSAADVCEVKVICQGKEINMEQTMMESSPAKSPIVQRQKKDQPVDPFACICFISKPKTNR